MKFGESMNDVQQIGRRWPFSFLKHSSVNGSINECFSSLSR